MDTISVEQLGKYALASGGAFSVKIIEGPGKWDLAVGFFNKTEVSFTIELTNTRRYIISTLVTGLQHEDGSGKTYIMHTAISRLAGFFDSRTRSGYIRVTGQH